MDSAFSIIQKTRLIAILRNVPGTSISKVADALFQGGIRAVEITLNSTGALAMIKRVQNEFGDRMLVGAGTVIHLEHAKEAHRAGARFLISPNVDPEVIEYGCANNLEVISGAYTPTEIIKAHDAGAQLVKIFPSGTKGSSYIRDLQGPLSHIPMIAVGGVTLENASEFIKSGACAVGVGSALIHHDALINEDYNAIRERANLWTEAVGGINRDDRMVKADKRRD